MHVGRHPSELAEADRAISAALTLLPLKERTRPPIVEVLKHATNWPSTVQFDHVAAGKRVAEANTIKEFDERLNEALAASLRSSAVMVGPGLRLGDALTGSINARRAAALAEEAAALAERLRPNVEAALGDLRAASAGLPPVDANLDAEAIMAADAGSEWRRAHDAVGVLLLVAGLAPAPHLGDGRADLLSSQHRHLSSILPLLVIADVGAAVHDGHGVDRTPSVAPDRYAQLLSVRGFAKETAPMAASAILMAVAQGRWETVSLGFDPSGSVTLQRLHDAFTSRLVTDAEARQYEAGFRRVGAR